MTHADHGFSTQITVVIAPGCHFCDDAHEGLAHLQRQGHHLIIDLVEATSREGAALLATHRPAMNPLVLVDGQYFSAGRLPRRKLEAVLQQRARSQAVTSHG